MRQLGMPSRESSGYPAFLAIAIVALGSSGAACAAIVGADFDQTSGADAGGGTIDAGDPTSASPSNGVFGAGGSLSPGTVTAGTGWTDAGDSTSSKTSPSTGSGGGTATTCTPQCSNKTCGASDGCDGTCGAGSCAAGMACVSSTCVASEILLYGGNGDTVYGDTWLFDGTTWRAQTGASAPQARYWHGMATLNQQVVLFGGYTADNEYLGDTWIWAGAAGWTPRDVAGPSARDGHAMATLGNTVVLFGGVNAGGYLNDTWLFDGSAWTQSHPSTSPPARTGAMMATLGNVVVLYGGETTGPDGGAAKVYLEDTWIFDGETWTRDFVATPPPTRTSGAAATLGSDVVLFGGSSMSTGALGDTWIWNGASWQNESTPASAPSPRVWESMASLEGTIVMFGGWNGSNANGLGDMWTFEQSTWVNTTPAIVPPPRWGQAMVAW